LALSCHDLRLLRMTTSPSRLSLFLSLRMIMLWGHFLRRVYAYSCTGSDSTEAGRSTGSRDSSAGSEKGGARACSGARKKSALFTTNSCQLLSAKDLVR